MCAVMYRQRPSIPAIILACVVFFGGTILVVYLRPLLETGEIQGAPVLMTGCVTCILSGALLIIAFSRYQFTHLWKSTGAIHSDKYKNHGKKNRRTSRTK